MTKGTNVLFRDVSLILTAVLLCIVLIFVIFINEEAKKADGEDVPQASLIFEITWPHDIDVDIDMWVHSEGAKETVGFRRKHGNTMDLLRDDINIEAGEVVSMNAEILYVRNPKVGRYYFNIHYYDPTNSGEIPVQARVRGRGKNNDFVQIYNGARVLKMPGHELTVLSFDINEEGLAENLSFEFYGIVNGTRIDE